MGATPQAGETESFGGGGGVCGTHTQRADFGRRGTMRGAFSQQVSGAYVASVTAAGQGRPTGRGRGAAANPGTVCPLKGMGFYVPSDLTSTDLKSSWMAGSTGTAERGKQIDSYRLSWVPSPTESYQEGGVRQGSSGEGDPEWGLQGLGEARTYLEPL